MLLEPQPGLEAGRRHRRTPSLDTFKARVSSLNCYAQHEVDDGTPAARLVPVVPAPGSPERSTSSWSSRSKGHTPTSRSLGPTPKLRSRAGSPPETKPLGTLAQLGTRSDAEAADTDDRAGWYAIQPTRFSVRSQNYLVDHRKMPSMDSVFRCVAVDLFTSDGLLEDFATRPGSSVHELLHTRRDAELFVLNISLPGPPTYSLVHVFERTPVGQRLPGSERAHRLYDQFVAAEPAWRDKRLKILASCVSGPLAIRSAVPARPAIMGTKVPLRWHRHERSLEVVLDVAFSSVAAPVWRLMRGVTRKVVLDLALIIEATEEEQLPEQVLGCMQWHKPNMAEAQSAPSAMLKPPGADPAAQRPNSAPNARPNQQHK